jgi:hypothetical protein
MAQILITKFAGMAPSISPKLLPEGFGTEVKNLDTRFGDFRPFFTPATVQSATAGATLYRFATNSTFITNANDVDYARGPLASDTTERTYYSGDGVPKVTDINLVVRTLGVPKSTTAAVLTKVVVDELTTDEASTYYIQLGEKLKTFISKNLVVTYIGATRTGVWVGAIPSPSTNYEDQLRANVPYTIVNGVKTPTKEIWKALFSEGVESDPDNYQAILRARAAAATFPTLKAELLTYLDAAGSQLFTDAQAQTFVDYVNNLASPNNDYIKKRSEKLQALADQFVASVTGGDGISNAINAAWVNFYNKADVLASITKGKNTLAEQLASITVVLSTDTTYDFQGGS